jgi:hypothetical protein
VSKSSLATISAARSLLGKHCRASSLNPTQVARWSAIVLMSPPTPTTSLFIAVPPTGSWLLGGKQRRERVVENNGGKAATGRKLLAGKAAGSARCRWQAGPGCRIGATGAPDRILPRRSRHENADSFIGRVTAPAHLLSLHPRRQAFGVEAELKFIHDICSHIHVYGSLFACRTQEIRYCGTSRWLPCLPGSMPYGPNIFGQATAFDLSGIHHLDLLQGQLIAHRSM